jgi:hypothetical protein
MISHDLTDWVWLPGEQAALPSAEYHLRQAEIASRMALIESDPAKLRALHLLAMEHYDKAEKAKTGEPSAYRLPNGRVRRGPES